MCQKGAKRSPKVGQKWSKSGPKAGQKWAKSRPKAGKSGSKVSGGKYLLTQYVPPGLAQKRIGKRRNERLGTVEP